jgi:hypothetical protein
MSGGGDESAGGGRALMPVRTGPGPVPESGERRYVDA